MRLPRDRNRRTQQPAKPVAPPAPPPPPMTPEEKKAFTAEAIVMHLDMSGDAVMRRATGAVSYLEQALSIMRQVAAGKGDMRDVARACACVGHLAELGHEARVLAEMYNMAKVTGMLRERAPAAKPEPAAGVDTTIEALSTLSVALAHYYDLQDTRLDAKEISEEECEEFKRPIRSLLNKVRNPDAAVVALVRALVSK